MTDRTDAVERRTAPPVVGSLGDATRKLRATVEVAERLAESRAALLQAASGVVAIGERRSGTVVSRAEAASRTGRHPEVLRRWCADGRIPAIRIGRAWAISADTLALLMQHRSRSRPRLSSRAPS
jgi:excisionase family DNA binding protein